MTSTRRPCGLWRARTRAEHLTWASILGGRAHPPPLPAHDPVVRLVALLARSDTSKDVAPIENSSVLVGANAWVRPMLCAMAASGARAIGERCGMVIDRAAAAAADEQRGERRGDPRAASPALGLAAAAWS